MSSWEDLDWDDPTAKRPGECEDPCPQCGYSVAEDHTDETLATCAERFALDSLTIDKLRTRETTS